MAIKISGQDELMKTLEYQILQYEDARESIPKRVAEAGVKRARQAYGGGGNDGNRTPTVYMQKLGRGSWGVTAIGADLPFVEYGTGIVGKSKPHPEVGVGVGADGNRYVYDYKNHGDKGWVYPVKGESNMFRHSKGMVGKRGMYYASLKMREALSQYTLELARKRK